MNTKIPFIKRTLDILLSSIGLLLTLPLYPIIALIIRLESKGPIFYIQERVNGLLASREDGELVFQTFKMIKFRTMVQHTETSNQPFVTRQGDARITRFGHFLRRSRLDEIPQFINVLKGEMSLVGPRPERPELLSHLAAIIPFFEERVRDIKPGITGLAQINLSYTGRLSETHPLAPMKEILTNPHELPNVTDSLADDMRTKVLFDHAYAASLINVRSYLMTEFKIIWMTVGIMARIKGR